MNCPYCLKPVRDDGTEVMLSNDCEPLELAHPECHEMYMDSMDKHMLKSVREDYYFYTDSVEPITDCYPIN